MRHARNFGALPDHLAGVLFDQRVSANVAFQRLGRDCVAQQHFDAVRLTALFLRFYLFLLLLIALV